jgi:hypothetical protein
MYHFTFVIFDLDQMKRDKESRSDPGYGLTHTKLCESFFRKGVSWYSESMKSQTPSTKLQTSLKFQYSITKAGLEFGILTIVICLIFEIYDLEFLFLQHSTNPNISPPLLAARFNFLPVYSLVFPSYTIERVGFR